MLEKPNILWIMTDEQRYDSLGCYGSSWARTPNLDCIADEGVVFTNAVTQSPLCIPARIALLTGMYPNQVGVWRNEDDVAKRDRLDHLTYHFKECGYTTVSFGKHHYCSPNQAFDYEEDIVLSDYVGYTRFADQYNEEDFDAFRYDGPTPWLLAGRYPAGAGNTPEAQIIRKAISWLDRLPMGRPFFLRISFNGPHTPVVPPEPYDTLIPENAIRLPEETGDPNPPTWLRALRDEYSGSSSLLPSHIGAIRRCYYGYTSFIDQQIGILLETLRAKGLSDKTILVFLSDHGTHLADYGLVQKQTFYEPVVRVPFIFYYPAEFARGARINTPVEIRSLLPTLMEVAAVAGEVPCDAVSLAPALLSGEEPPECPVYSEFCLNPLHIRTDERLVMVRRGKWKLSLNVDHQSGEGNLYDLREDPYERKNLYSRPEFHTVTEELKGAIFDHLKHSGTE